MFPLYYNRQNIFPNLWIYLEMVQKASNSPFHVIVLIFFKKADIFFLFYICFTISSGLPFPSLFWPSMFKSSGPCMLLMQLALLVSVSILPLIPGNQSSILLHIPVKILLNFQKCEFCMVTLAINSNLQ